MHDLVVLGRYANAHRFHPLRHRLRAQSSTSAPRAFSRAGADADYLRETRIKTKRMLRGLLSRNGSLGMTIDAALPSLCDLKARDAGLPCVAPYGRSRAGELVFSRRIYLCRAKCRP